MLSHAVGSAAGAGATVAAARRTAGANPAEWHQVCKPELMSMSRNAVASQFPDTVASKVPEVTLGFWIIEVAATTLGETGGDTLSMTLGLGISPAR
jgi:hypothetical protein